MKSKKKKEKKRYREDATLDLDARAEDERGPEHPEHQDEYHQPDRAVGDLTGKEFNVNNILAMNFTTQHDRFE